MTRSPLDAYRQRASDDDTEAGAFAISPPAGASAIPGSRSQAPPPLRPALTGDIDFRFDTYA